MKEFKVEGHKSSLLPKDKKWKLVWADEFDSNTLDQNKWLFRTNFWGKKAEQFCTDGITFDGNSNMIMKPVKCDDGKIRSAQLQTGTLVYDYLDLDKDKKNIFGENFMWPFDDDRPSPKFMHRYGYYEIRCKVQKEGAWWSAFWLQSPSTGAAPNPSYCGVEVDVMEGFTHREKDKITSGIYFNGYGKAGISKARVSYDTKEEKGEDGFHRFGVLWTPSEYVFYCDGEETARTDGPISHVEQFILVSTEVRGYRFGDGKSSWEGIDHILDDEFVVDYVRVFDEIE